MSPATRARWMFRTGCVLLAAFAALSVFVYFNRDSAFEDPEEVARLQRSEELGKTTRTTAGAFDWPQWRGPNRDGHSAQTGLNLDWNSDGEPPIRWRIPIGDGFGSIAVAQGRVYTMFQDGSQEVIGCFDAETGNERWRHAYEARFKDEFGSGPRSTPTVDGDLVFAVGATGVLHCLNAATGKVQWMKSLADEFGAGVPKWGFSFSPLVVGDLLLINPGVAGAALAALDRATGAVRWKAFDVGGGYSSPILARLGGTRQALFFTAYGLISIVPETGAEVWRQRWKTDYDANITTPIVFDDYVFISSGYNAGCALLRIEKKDDGFHVNVVYKHTRFSNRFSTSVFHRGYIYGFKDALLLCLDVRDSKGKAKWDERGFDYGTLLAVEDHLIIYGENGLLGVAAATPTGYLEKGRMRIFDRPLCWSAPAAGQWSALRARPQGAVCLDLRKK
ncbi:MAG: PQQ-binding-like beta-propeller repeat protein [Gemmataceae bacterium]